MVRHETVRCYREPFFGRASQNLIQHNTDTLVTDEEPTSFVRAECQEIAVEA